MGAELSEKIETSTLRFKYGVEVKVIPSLSLKWEVVHLMCPLRAQVESIPSMLILVRYSLRRTLLGVFLPDAALSRIRLEFDNKDGPLGYYTVSPVTGTVEDLFTLSGALVASDLPHIRIQIGK